MVRFFWLLVCLGMAWTAPARAENRFALVIGINEYLHVPKLQKAVADAQAMTNVLRSVGYEVTQLINPARRDIYTAILMMTGKLQPGDTLFLHFSGHGVQIDGENYLLPADIASPESGDKDFLKSEAIALSMLIDRFRASGVRAQILVIDACRDNPFASSGLRSVGGTRGLGPQAAPPKGTFIMFSAGQGQSALDSLNEADREPNSPFTRMLLKKMTIEGKSLTDLAREVRDEVETAANGVNHEQRPAYYDELSGSPFYFVAPKGRAANPPVLVSQPEAAAPPHDLTAELAFWDYIKGAGNADLFSVYLEKYGDRGQFSGIARIESARLKQAKLTVPPPLPHLPAPELAPPVSDAKPQGQTVSPRPGFNCAAARTGVEIAICANAGLADKDRKMGELYRQLQALASGSDQASLTSSQRAWRQRRDSCGTLATGDRLDGCIGNAYDSRIAQLRQMTTAPGEGAKNAAPSFDCRNAYTAVEHQICQEPALAVRDRRLASLFGAALATMAPARRDGLMNEQSAWLIQRERCANVPENLQKCIADSYDHRIASLNGLMR